MIARLIRWSLENRFLVVLATLIVAAWGVWSVLRTPLDALPDLSDVQVIIRTAFPGQAPRIVENQVTYPLTTTMLSVPGAKTVRGYSFFGDSFVYVLFEDGTDLYWARSRVLEYLNQVQSRLPRNAQPSLGPDATGVGWIYEYALVDRSGRHDLSQLRAIQDWFLKYELKTVPNVAEVATLGGVVRQYQVVLQPDRLRAYGVTQREVIEAIRGANQEAGGSVLELAEAEYVVRATGYLRNLDDFRSIPVRTGAAGVPVRLADVAHLQVGPELRRGISELDGEGEVTGGIIVMRSGQNALETIEAVKAKLEQLEPGLPDGVEIVETYDRSGLIQRSVRNLTEKLAEEFIVVALVCFAFLFHLRSAFVAIISLPLGVLMAFVVMQHQGINANIMSLGGIAIAIGAMVDAAIVMIENVAQTHRALARATSRSGGEQRRALGAHRRGKCAGRARALLQPADHHAVVHPDFHARGAGGTLVCAAGIHQDLCDGRRRGSRRHTGARADGVLHSRQHPTGRQESTQSLAGACLSPAARSRAGTTAGHHCPWASCCLRLRRSRSCAWAGNSCHPWTKAICSTCPPRCLGSRWARPRSSCNRWTG